MDYFELFTKSLSQLLTAQRQAGKGHVMQADLLGLICSSWCEEACESCWWRIRKKCECNFILIGIMGMLILTVFTLLNVEFKMWRLFFFFCKYGVFFFPLCQNGMALQGWLSLLALRPLDLLNTDLMQIWGFQLEISFFLSQGFHQWICSCLDRKMSYTGVGGIAC